MICTNKGYESTCVVDVNTSRQCVDTIRATNTSIVLIDTLDEQGGYLSNRLAYIRNATRDHSDLIWLNQYENPANPKVHYDLTAKAIFEEFDQVDYLFVATGTAVTLTDCADFIRRHSLQTKLIAVDSAGSVAPSQLILNISLRDLAPETILACNNILDDVDHCMKANTSPHLVEQQYGHRDFISGTLAEFILNHARIDADKATIFSPFGLGVLDLGVAMFIYQQSQLAGTYHDTPNFFSTTGRWTN